MKRPECQHLVHQQVAYMDLSRFTSMKMKRIRWHIRLEGLHYFLKLFLFPVLRRVHFLSRVLPLCTIFGRMPGFEPKLLRLQPGDLPMSYTHYCGKYIELNKEQRAHRATGSTVVARNQVTNKKLL